MARKPEKSTVRNIINNLINSEIPEIQTVAKELADWTKQLEEHSWKLQHYASEIENLAAAEAEGGNEVSLTELVKDLEKTLAILREKPADTAAPRSRSIAARPNDIEEETEIEEEVMEEEVEKDVGEKVEEEVEKIVDSVADTITGKEIALRKSRASGVRDDNIAKEDTYITPEGFVLKRRR